MQSKLFRSKVIQNKKLNHKFNLVRFKLIDHVFSFKPGQFTTLKVSNSIFRCYSIFSLPTLLPYWEIFVDITPGGPGTTFIKSLKAKNIIETLGPSGTFTCKKSGNKNFIFLATGCGLAPLKPMVENLLNSSGQPKIFLLWGLRHEKDIVLKNTLDNWIKKYPNFYSETVLSQPGKKWKGKKGHVNSYIESITKNLPINETSVYLSGNSEFIKNSLENLNNLNFPTDNIYFESYC